MTINNLGMTMYDDVYELNYFLLISMGFYTDPYGYVYNSDTRDPIMINGKRLKASTSPNNIVYAGNGDIILDTLRNVNLVTTLLGYVVDMKIVTEGFNFMSQYITETPDRSKSSLTIKMNAFESITTNSYCNRALKFVDMIITLAGNCVDLSNFDEMEIR